MIITTVIAIDVNWLGCIRCPSKSELLLNEFLRPESYNCFLYFVVWYSVFPSFFFSFITLSFFPLYSSCSSWLQNRAVVDSIEMLQRLAHTATMAKMVLMMMASLIILMSRLSSARPQLRRLRLSRQADGCLASGRAGVRTGRRPKGRSVAAKYSVLKVLMLAPI